MSLAKSLVCISWYRAKGHNIYMDGTGIEQIPVFKYLGVYLDQSFTFEYHINTAYKNHV